MPRKPMSTVNLQVFGYNADDYAKALTEVTRLLAEGHTSGHDDNPAGGYAFDIYEEEEIHTGAKLNDALICPDCARSYVTEKEIAQCRGEEFAPFCTHWACPSNSQRE